MERELSGMILAILALIFQWLVMINGWGLEPRSWLWIIGGSIASGVFLSLAQKLVRK